MKKSTIIAAIASVMLLAAPQQAEAQFFKKLGKAISDTAKESWDKAKNASAQSDKQNNTPANKVGLYKIHVTSATKTITIDGGVSHLGDFHNSRAIVTGKMAQFVIDREGNKVFDIPRGYAPRGTVELLGGDQKGVGYDSNRLMVFSKDEQAAIIYDENGKVIKKFTETYNASGFCDGIAVIQKPNTKSGQWTSSRMWLHIDVNGNVLSSKMPVSSYPGGPTYRVFPLREGLSPVYDEETKKWGFRNAKCQWVIQPTFGGFGADDEGGFWNGLSRAKDKETEKWGFINNEGKWVIQPTYSIRPGNFYGCYAMVFDKSERKYFIDKTGKIVWQEEKPGAFAVNQFLPNDLSIWSEGDFGYIIDSSFKKKKRIDEWYGTLTVYTDSMFQWQTNKLDVINRVYDWDGNMLLEFGNLGGNFSDGRCAINNFYCNTKGEVVVRFEDTKF